MNRLTWVSLLCWMCLMDCCCNRLFPQRLHGPVPPTGCREGSWMRYRECSLVFSSWTCRNRFHSAHLSEERYCGSSCGLWWNPLQSDSVFFAFSAFFGRFHSLWVRPAAGLVVELPLSNQLLSSGCKCFGRERSCICSVCTGALHVAAEICAAAKLVPMNWEHGASYVGLITSHGIWAHSCFITGYLLFAHLRYCHLD